MAFWDFFRVKEEKQEQEIKNISLESLNSEIKKQKSQYESEIENEKDEINKNIKNLISDLKSKREILENVNLDKRKEDERLKKIVLENLQYYISHLNSLIKDLQDLEKDITIQEYVIRIQHIFNVFKKDSTKSLEKATILIGKEFEQIIDIIKQFSKNFNIIVENNKPKFEKISKLEEIEKQNKEIYVIKKNVEEIMLLIRHKEKEEEELKKNSIVLEKEYDRFKQSEKYNKYLEEEKRQKQLIDKFNQKVSNLKEKINIKLLLKKFHYDEKKSRILQGYQENFIRALENDKSLEILNLTREALNLDIENEVITIKKENMILNEKKDNLVEKEKINLENKVNQNKYKVLELENNIREEKKKLLRFEEKKKESLERIENTLKLVFGEINLIK
jgi:hypothetical protein